MTNMVLFNEMIKRYNEMSFCSEYIFGIRYNGNICMIINNHDILNSVLKLDKASRGAGMSLRFKPNKEQKNYLASFGYTVLCSEKFFDELVKESKYNKGEIFEKLVTEYFGQVWEKDSVPFYLDGDITVNEVPYQIKFESATFTNERQLARLS